MPEDVYDQYVNQFLPEWVQFEDVTGQWLLPGQPNTGLNGSLASVPANIQMMNAAITSDLQAMLGNDPGSTAYVEARSNIVFILQQQIDLLQGLNIQISTYSANLETATGNIVAQTNSGALSSALDSYQQEIDDLNSQLSSLRLELVGDYIALVAEYGSGYVTGTFMVIGKIGVRIPYFPIKAVSGVIAIFGAVFYAVSIYSIQSTKIDIANTQSEIQLVSNSLDTDSNSLTSLGVVIDQINGFSGLEEEAATSLEELITALSALMTDLDSVVADANDGDPQEALDEWNSILTDASALLTDKTYVWPDDSVCYDCKTVAPTSNGVLVIAWDGSIFQMIDGDAGWTSLPGSAISLAASDDAVIAISGKPITASDPQNPRDISYQAMKLADGAWIAISGFQVANIAVYGSSIYAIRNGTSNSDPSDGGTGPVPDVVQYAGSGTTWTSLGSPDNEDVPAYLAATAGGVVVTTLLFGRCYFWDGSAWTRLGSDMSGLLAPVCGGQNASITDTSYRAYLADPQSGSMTRTAQNAYSSALSDGGIQYIVDQGGTLSSVDTAGESQAMICQEVQAIFGNVEGTNFYFMDKSGNLSRVAGYGSTATITPLPDVPDGQSA